MHGCISLLVDTTCHVFNVFGFILQTTVIVVSLHTCLYFTPDGSAQLSAKRAFLEKMAKNTKLFFTSIWHLKLEWDQPSHHPFSSLDFLYDRLHIKVSKFSPWRRRQLHRPRGKKLDGITDRAHVNSPARLRHKMLAIAAILPYTCSARPLFWSYRCEACPWFHSLRHRRDKSHSAGLRPRG